GWQAEGLTFESKDKSRIDQDAGERVLDAGVEPSKIVPGLVEAEEQVDGGVVFGHRSPERACREPRKNFASERTVVVMAREDLSPRRRIARSRRVGWANDAQALDAGVDSPRREQIVDAVRVGASDDGDAERVRAGGNADLVHAGRVAIKQEQARAIQRDFHRLGGPHGPGAGTPPPPAGPQTRFRARAERW